MHLAAIGRGSSKYVANGKQSRSRRERRRNDRWPGTELPSDAVDTGHQQQGCRLWLSNDRLIAFVVTADGVEAWPSSTEEFECA